MNKYELTAEILKKQRIAVNETDEVFNDGVAKAVDAVDDFWEARKVTVTRKEAEWLDRLMENFELPEALYYVERCGRGYAFEYTLENGTYVLSSNRDSLDEEKNRLWNAVFYGYEVEKDKLYRARHKLTGEYLSQNYAKTGYYHDLDHFHILKLSKKDWEELGVLDNKVYEIEEVEE